MGIFYSGNEMVGIDVGASAVRLVQLKKGGANPSLVAFGSAQLPPNIAQSDSKLDQQKVAEIIKRLIKSSNVSTKYVNTALPGSTVFSTIIALPPMSQADLAQAVRYQAEQNIPLKIDEVKIDWQIVRENPITKEKAVMIIAAPKAKTEKVMNLFEMADLDVVCLETSSIAVARAISSPNEPLVMVLNLGASASEITIIENGIVSHVRNLPVGGTALTRVIARDLGLDNTQAEQFKMRFGLSQDKLEGQVYKTIKPLIDNIVEEIQRSIKFYNTQFGGEVKKIFLTGGTARLPEIISCFKSELNIEVVYGNSWGKINFQPALSEKLNESNFEFSCAVGLAMGEA